MASLVKKNNLQQLQMEQNVYELLINGWSNKKIIDILISDYDYKYDNARKLITKVLHSMVPAEKEDIENLKTKYLNMYQDLYNKAVNDKNLKVANEILKSIVKLQGLDVQKIEAKVDITYEIEF